MELYKNKFMGVYNVVEVRDVDNEYYGNLQDEENIQYFVVENFFDLFIFNRIILFLFVIFVYVFG